MTMKKYFDVPAAKYVEGKLFSIYRPASLNHPKDNAVMFIGEEYMSQADAFLNVKQCLIFWPDTVSVPESIENMHAIVKCKIPRLEYCLFFRDNAIRYLPEKESGKMIDYAFIADDAVIGERVSIMPGAYIGGEVKIGNDVYIGTGARIVGEVIIGNGVVIRENTVIGADGLSTDRDGSGKAATMPQFGGVILEDDVQIGANTVIARGAIDSTVIGRGSKIDNQCFISHNVSVGEDTFVVGETIMFGSSSTGKQAFISGNSTIRNGVHVGEQALVGMGCVVVKNVEDGSVVKGNPAK